MIGLVLLLAGCGRPSAPSWQGYLEGEFIYVAAPLAGRLDHLAVEKGDRVEAGAELFTLEREAELAGQQEAAERVRQLTSRLDDLRKGQRPTEIAALEARLGQATTVAELSSRQLERATNLISTRAVAEEDFDRTRLTHEANTQRLTELEAQLATAKLGGRADQVMAAEAEVASAKAALARADWNVTQKAQSAPVAALVYDRLFRPGEFVPAGTPVVSLLPPQNIRVRFFVPEGEFASLKAGDPVKLTITGQPAPIPARITYLSSRPEYTPPVLYNRDNRAKLVFMVEATPVDPVAARDLHPGQPADVTR